MWSNERSYSNPIYDVVDQTNMSFSRPLMINIEPMCSNTCMNTANAPLLLLANCLTSPSTNNQHNYVNQLIEEDENHDPLYAKPRKRCVTLEDEPIVIPPKASRICLNAIKPQRAQLVSTTVPVVTLVSTNEPIDEINQFIARENERVERVKLRRRQGKAITTHNKPLPEEKPLPAFSNPNYTDMPILNDSEHNKLSKSVLV